jgi:hypothetical protein
VDRQEIGYDRKKAIATLDFPVRSLDLAYAVPQSDPDDETDALQAEAARLDDWPRAPMARVMDWCERAHAHLAALTQPSSIGYWQERLLPFFLQSPFLDRAYRKPRGYAGDYLTIQMMYDVAPAGETAFARGVDAWALSQPCPRAVRNRRTMVRTLLGDLALRFPGEPLSVTSLGCGPAAEAFDYNGDASEKIRFTLVDIDVDAVRFVRNRAEMYGLGDRINPVLGNLIKTVRSRSIALPDNQHACYSLGLIDYFSDELVVRLLDYVHGRLRKGGVLMLGNFRRNHPNAAFFTHALDWPLHLRSEQQLRALAAQSKFAKSPTRVSAESEGVQLFIECVKA